MAPLRFIILALFLCVFIVTSVARPVTFPQRKNPAKRCPPGYRYIRNVGCRKVIEMKSRYMVTYRQQIRT
ncbi:hypothetical protein WH47_11974 [Habropoda laboriosa]|uniref:Uncharacterized protein n=1 Tax=Habropoda laboriosa TaxID=597456 RepID=A0A0L7R7R1_9HYME|nr:hypothetical protein WH47_11974 [Habropoda laboriosa]